MEVQASSTGVVRRLVLLCGNWFFQHRNTVFPIVLLALFLGFKPVAFGGNPELDGWLDFLGLLVASSGQALRAAVIGYAYIQRGGKDKKVHAEQLVTQGFFAHARNPLYIGNLLILLGLFIIHNNPFVYALGILFFLAVYISLVAAEENFLLRKFGAEYADYCRRVNRWLPNLTGLRETVQGMRFNWRRVLIQDHGSAYGWMIMAIMIVAYEAILSLDLEPSRMMLKLLGITFVLLTFGVLAIRHLKRSRILTDQPV
jgi:protein-S-isoprenylcysteine O-methyltransferase Ste14